MWCPHQIFLHSFQREIMPQCCSMPLCSEAKGGHKFPRDKTLLKKWLNAIRRDKFMPTRHSRVCKKHFKPDDYILPKESMKKNPTPFLKKEAVPSRFSWNEENYEVNNIKEKRNQRAFNRQLKKDEVRRLINSKNDNKKEEFFETEFYTEIESSSKNVGIQCCLCECDANLTSLINATSSKKSEDNLQTNHFCIENFKDENRAAEIQFYSGFDDYDHFMFVFNLFGDEVNDLLYYPSMKPSRGKRLLSPCNEFFLTLVKLRRNMCNIELSFHFKISETSVSNIFITWINYLYCKFKDLKLWVPKIVIDENLMFLGKSNPCTVIIDCTEIKIDKAKNPVSQQSSYSTYKSANTLKVLVGISASGCVTFISDAYGGSISDRELFEKCGLIGMLQQGDIILGDRGFNIQDLVCHKDITVNMPEFLNNASRFDTHQLRTSKRISSNRIQVERVIGLGKTYKILAGKIGSTLVPLGGRIIFVCFMLTNLRSNIV